MQNLSENKVPVERKIKEYTHNDGYYQSAGKKGDIKIFLEEKDPSGIGKKAKGIGQ